jgi:ATP-dependent Clp protease ATP-binding subunit ClpC
MFDSFTEKAIRSVMFAQEESRRLVLNFVGTEQILLGLLSEGTGSGPSVLKKMGVSLKDARREVERIVGRGSGPVARDEIPFTPRAKKVLEVSGDQSRVYGHGYIGTEHLLLALIKDKDGLGAQVLEILGVDLEELRTLIIEDMKLDLEFAGLLGQENDQSKPRLGEWLDTYGTNLNEEVKKGEIDPVIGRDREVERMTQILLRKRKSNPVLLGEAGVGKTALAEGLAQKIVLGDVPDLLEEKKVIMIDLAGIVAGTKYRGEFEEKLKGIMNEVDARQDLILFVDEMHTLVGAGAAEGAVDASNILKPALARGKMSCIGATTLDEYQKYVEKDPALERRFQPVRVPEPTITQTVSILFGLRERYEQYHCCQYADEALYQSAVLSDRYIPDRYLPDKALDIVDESGAIARLGVAGLAESTKGVREELEAILRAKESARREQNFEESEKYSKLEKEKDEELKEVTESFLQAQGSTEPTTLGYPRSVNLGEVESIVSAWTLIPLNQVSQDESKKLLMLEDILHTRVIGQEVAVSAVARSIRRARTGLKDPNKPIACMIFCGPTGVGKTELTKALGTYYFGRKECMIRLDMSEFMEKHTVSKLIGAPPGYLGWDDGGHLADQVRRQPHSIILFDEIEKAHPAIYNIMLQMFDDGRITDGKGKLTSFKNSIIVLTSNVGAKEIQEQVDEDRKSRIYNTVNKYDRMKKVVQEALKLQFRPEFLNRLDETIVFRPLNKMEIGDICTLMLKDNFSRLEESKNIKLEVTRPFKESLIEAGFDPLYGARPLRRVIMSMLEDTIAQYLLSGGLNPGDHALITFDENGSVIILPGLDNYLQENPMMETSEYLKKEGMLVEAFEKKEESVEGSNELLAAYAAQKKSEPKEPKP